MRIHQLLGECRSYSKIILRNIHISSRCGVIHSYPKIVGNKVLKNPAKEITLEDKIFNSLKGKLVYNSLVTRKNMLVRWKIRAEEFRKRKKVGNPYVVPISLKYMFEDDEISKCSSAEEIVMNEREEVILEDEEDTDDEYMSDGEVNLPYGRSTEVDMDPEYIDEEEITHEKRILLSCQDINPKPIHGRRWMSDYECFDEEIDEDSSFETPDTDYGTPDPMFPASNVPCGGCGAHLHCRNPSIPGYLPQELFKKCKRKDLLKLICQRCTFLKNYNTALAVNVDPETYPKLLAQIKNKDALVILMIDMTDFPCSIWPGLLETIGSDKPLMVIGNKIDLLPGDNPGWLNTALESLRKQLPKKANILHVGFTSAKTGYGVEELINKLFMKWGDNGDVYLVGCANVGKSSLFNALISSDYCRSKATELVQRAVTSPWPGTTMNLLKFPILKLSGWKSFMRTTRIIEQRKIEHREKTLAKLQAKIDNITLSKLPTIIGTIGMTFHRPPDETDTSNIQDDKLFDMPSRSRQELTRLSKKAFDPNDVPFRSAKWCYDTPGVMHNDQVIDLLTTDELMKTLPQVTIRPRIFSVRPKQSLFIAGLSRIDVLDCDYRFCRIIVYASSMLPTTLCETKYCKDVYETLIGTSYMAVPCGSMNRLEKWPALEYRDDFPIVGQGNALVSSEIVLSSIGWIGISLPLHRQVTIRPWTPLARGIYFRDPPVLKLTARLRKKRVANTPTYFMGNV